MREFLREPKLTLTDEVFICAFSVIAAGGFRHGDHLELALIKVKETLPEITRGHPHLEPVAEQADRIVHILPVIKDSGERREEWNSILFHGASRLSEFHFWRLGRLDAARQFDNRGSGRRHAG